MDAISCLVPPPAALLAPSFADAAIARALHFSSTTTTMSPDSSASASASASSSSSLSHHHHHTPLLTALPSSHYPPPPVPTPHAATCYDSVLVADSPRRRASPTPAPGRRQLTHHNHALAPAGARAGKRRSRASRRAPTTYISTDAANFRLMVQQITGVQADGDLAAAGVDMAALDAAALLGLAAAAGNGNGNPQLLPPAGDEASAAALRQHQLQLELQQQPCFPTLDSWNVVMCETNSSAEMML